LAAPSRPILPRRPERRTQDVQRVEGHVTDCTDRA
jgi:hypothetical protein